MLPDFQYLRAQSLSEAIGLLTANKGKGRILAGGTDLLLQMGQGNIWGNPCPTHLISLRDIADLGTIRLEDREIVIGANVTHREVELSSFVKSELSALHDASGQVGSVQIRNVATIAGNICNAAPSADTAAPLLALGAVVKAIGPKGERTIALSDFYRGPGRTVLEADEILREIRIPQLPAFSGSAYIKLARRKAMDLALLGVAIYISVTPEKSHVVDVRIGLNTAAPTPIRPYKAEEILKGVQLNGEAIDEAAAVAARDASPRSSFRSTSEYRRQIIQVLVRRSLHKALDRVRDQQQ